MRAQGQLFHFNEQGGSVAFEWSRSTDKKERDGVIGYLIFIGGLGDGFLPVPYLNELNRRLPLGWKLVQVRALREKGTQ